MSKNNNKIIDFNNAFRSYVPSIESDENTRKKIKEYIFNNKTLHSIPADEGILIIEDYIRSIHGFKTKYINIYKDFVKWLNNTYNMTLKTNMPSYYMADTRRIELVKFLQEPHTREEILDEFIMNERTLNDDFAALEKGIEVLGYRLKFSFKKYGRYGRYTIDSNNKLSTCHPIFLPLDMTELSILLKRIPEYLKTDEQLSKSYQEIIKKVYPQLTEYTINKLGLDISNAPREMIYMHEYDTLENNIRMQIEYLFKDKRQKRTFVIKQGDEEIEIIGSIKGIDNGIIALNSENGLMKICIKDILKIKDFKEKYK